MMTRPIHAAVAERRPSAPYADSLELTARLEGIERKVWRDFHRDATPGARAELAMSAAEIGGATVLAAPGTDVLFFNRAVGFGTETPADAESLDEIVRYFQRAGAQRFFIQVNPSARPAGLYQWLEERNFSHYNNWVKLCRGVEDPPDAATELRIRRASAAEAAAIGALTAPSFDWPPVMTEMVARLVGRTGWHHYVATDGAMVVASAALFVDGETGYLGPAVTHPDHRGRGAQSAFIARRIRDAAAAGCSLLVTETAEDRPDEPAPSYRNLRRAGFETAYLRPNYIFTS